VIRRVPPGHPGEHPLGIQVAEALPERPVGDDGVPSLEIIHQRFPDLEQRRPRRHPDAAAAEALTGTDMQVEPRPTMHRFALHTRADVAMEEPAGHVRLVR